MTCILAIYIILPNILYQIKLKIAQNMEIMGFLILYENRD